VPPPQGGGFFLAQCLAQLFKIGPTPPTDIWLFSRPKANKSGVFPGRAGPPETRVCWARMCARICVRGGARLSVHDSRRGVALYLLVPALPARGPLGVDGLLSPLGQDPGRLHQALERDPRTAAGGLAGNERKRPAQSPPAYQKYRPKPAEMSTSTSGLQARGL